MNTYKIKVFRAGRHLDSAGNWHSFSQDDLNKIAQNYNIENHEAPIVIGHPQSDSPAWGWVKDLTVEQDELWANVQQVQQELKDYVNQGRFKKVSAAFYSPDDVVNPIPGHFYLRHIGFLGAQPPAIKGLGSVTFKESPFKPIIMTTEILEPQQEQDAIKVKESPAPDKKLIELERSLEKQARELEARERQIKLLEAKQAKIARRTRYDNHLRFLECLPPGKILPTQRRSVAEFMLSLDDGKFNFSEFMFAESETETPPEETEAATDKEMPDIQSVQVEWFKSQLNWFKEFLKSLPEQVEFREYSKSQDAMPHVIPQSALEKKIAAWVETLPKKGGK